jgi:hypothetical protein
MTEQDKTILRKQRADNELWRMGIRFLTFKDPITKEPYTVEIEPPYSPMKKDVFNIFD